MLAIALLLVIIVFLPAIARKRQEAFSGEET